MANNGFILNGECVNSAQLAKAICENMKPAYVSSYSNKYSPTGNITSMTCYNATGTGSVVTGLTWSPECAISGQSSSDADQVAAINSLLPAAITMLAVIWGARRVLDVIWSQVMASRPKSGDTE